MIAFGDTIQTKWGPATVFGKAVGGYAVMLKVGKEGTSHPDWRGGPSVGFILNERNIVEEKDGGKE